MANRLTQAMSPYLLQHADNPVDWQQWGEEAFAAARERDVPLLISIGYAACHWCHVMAHESFEDEATAAQMNEHFVCVKIDREEHPDVDSVYMEATQAMTGSGGWPMTVFATADGKPFYCGTYFPPTPRHGIPSFPQLLTAVAHAWAERRDEVLASADTITAELGQGRDFGAGGPVAAADLDTAVGLLERDFDAELGGFGHAPKFPPSTVLHFLNRHYVRTGDERSRRMVDTTCEAMWRGGMYDHLAGGFARYSVDATWTVPHFEKMLYDNALLARVYLGWTSADTRSGTVRHEGFLVARDTVEFMLRDLRTPEGGLASALDADAAGEEGTTYVWTPRQLVEVLGEEDGAWAAEHYGVTEAGTFEHGSSVLRLPSGLPNEPERVESVRTRLLAARAGRPQPMRDDKIVAAWNGMAITAICQVSSWMGDRDLVPDAVRIGELLRDVHVVEGRLRRVSRNGVVGPAPGVLEDYAHVASGFLTLHEYTADRSWLDLATGLLDAAMTHFAAGEGRYFDSADDASGLVVRPTDPTDGPTPAGVAALADALVTATALTADPTYREEADRVIARLAPIVARAPRAAGWAASVAEAMLTGPIEVAVVGGDEAARERFAHVARGVQRLGGVVVAGVAGGGAPLLRDRPDGGDGPVAYVCRGFVCTAPITRHRELVHVTQFGRAGGSVEVG